MTDYGEMLHVFVSLQHLIFCFPNDDSCGVFFCSVLFCFFAVLHDIKQLKL